MAAENGVGPRVAVIGAGWAGLAAALSLADSAPGASITVIDRKPYAGGRAFSFRDKETGMLLDNGHHVLLGCCDETVEFLGEVGMPEAAQFQPLLSIPVFCDGRWSTISSAQLPGALHLWPTLANYRHLTAADRLRALPMLKALREDPDQLDDTVFYDWLRKHGQSENSISRLWELVGVSVLNTRAREASAGQAVRAFQMGVMSGWKAARLGCFRVPLGDIGTRAAQVLRDRGVRVLLNQPVSQVAVEGGRVSGLTLQSGERMAADAVIAALPPDALLGVVPESTRQQPYFSNLAGLAWSPILNVHLHFDRPVFDGDLAAFVDATTQFVFNRGRLHGDSEADGRLLSVSISAATAERQQPVENVVKTVTEELRAAFPAARTATVVSARPVWQPHATFLQATGTGTLRRDSRTPIAGLFVAGDWTNTGWPASLESAIRSGRAAAQQVSHSNFAASLTASMAAGRDSVARGGITQKVVR